MRTRLFFAGLLFFVIGGALVVIAAWWGRERLLDWADTPITLASEKIIDFSRGTKLEALSRALAEQGVVDNELFFRVWARLFSNYSRFQAGLYKFEGSVSPATVAKKISSGDVFVPVVLQFTIPEGFTVAETIARLVALEVGSAKDFEALVTNKDFLRTLDIQAKSIEGYLYPATYTFSEKPTPEQVLRKMVLTFWQKLPAEYVANVSDRGLTLQQAVTFASLIELETQHEDEKSIISEVIWRRLKANMALGIDAAIIYGIKDYNGDLTFKHLKDSSNLYNTRVHRGLPPTPIGSPAASTLEAVLTPSDHGYWYYVLDPEQGTKHHFSKTLKEHNRYVQKLVRARRAERRANKKKK